MDPGRSINTHGLDYAEESARPAKRRARSAVACQRCKSRKQRCDNEFPTCSNCLSARALCSYGMKQIYPAGYVRALENHIAHVERGTVSTPRKDTNDDPAFVQEQAELTPSRDSNGWTDEAGRDDLERSLQTGVGFVATSPNSYLGTSSGLPLARLVTSAIDNPPKDPNRRTIASETNDGMPYAPSHPLRGAKNHSNNGDIRKLELPTDDTADKLIGAYFSKVHPKHPFLSRRKIYMLNADRKQWTQSNSSDHSAHRISCAILHLVYAIGARYMQLAHDDDCPSPQAHYAAAVADVDAMSGVRSLDKLEAMLLISIYQLRSPTGPGIWWVIGTAMRHCLDCGLHRKSAGVSPLLDQRRKRIFWTAYMLERSVARTVGRPYSVADRDIDVELPANVDDSLETDEEIEVAMGYAMAHPNQVTALTGAIHIMRVQQIESRISHTLCRVDRPISSIRPEKIAKLRVALENWKVNMPQASGSAKEGTHPYNTTDYHMIQYHKALVLLFLPSLPSVTPSHPDYRQLVYSAGQISQLYKRLHHNQSHISFSLLALHANFVAGLVLVYCFCLDTTIFNTSFSSDIRACSTMLYTISERWPAARKVRNAFESLVAATIEGNHDTSHLGPGHSRNTGQDEGRQPQTTSMGSVLRHASDRDFNQRAMGSVWGSFETTLENYQIDPETWMQDSIFQAMDAFPDDGSAQWGDVW